ncbi:protein eva-1 homolog B isoform X2 [Chrysemys picta bellii]|uniref:protein eva-1 homolog B isoform X2 n=1 Tax=Chrysemys picta bellii TaxID=8478 RepID=UPI0032B25C2F
MLNRPFSPTSQPKCSRLLPPSHSPRSRISQAAPCPPAPLGPVPRARRPSAWREPQCGHHGDTQAGDGSAEQQHGRLRPHPSLPAKPRRSLRDVSEEDEEEEEEEEEDTVDNVATESPLPITEIPLENHSPADGTLTVNVFASAEELERAQRLEERERIIREIWRNGQPDILGTGTVGRVHYY